MKEQVFATRDIKKGEPLNNAINRETGYFYFFTADGSALRAPIERRQLTPQQRAERDAAERVRKAEVAQRRQEREFRRAKLDEAEAARKDALRKQKYSAIDAKVAKLQERKARL